MTEKEKVEEFKYVQKHYEERLSRLRYNYVMLRKAVRVIPEATDYQANRYETDDEIVLTIHKENETYDIRFFKHVCPTCGDKGIKCSDGFGFSCKECNTVWEESHTKLSY